MGHPVGSRRTLKTTEQGRFDKEMPCCLGMFRRFSAGYKPEFYFLSHDM